jgi:hypothetical protein
MQQTQLNRSALPARTRGPVRHSKLSTTKSQQRGLEGWSPLMAGIGFDGQLGGHMRSFAGRDTVFVIFNATLVYGLHQNLHLHIRMASHTLTYLLKVSPRVPCK